jgi:hypothetical protein
MRSKYKIKSGVRGTHFGFTGEKIKELREKGMTYNEIQKAIGCSKSTISYHLSNKTP